MDKLAIGELMAANGRTDAHDPKPAEIPLAAAPVAVGKAARTIRGLFHGPIELAFGEEIAFGELGELLPFGAAHSAALYSRHGVFSFLWTRGDEGTQPLAFI